MKEWMDEKWTLAFHKSMWLLALGNIFMLGETYVMSMESYFTKFKID